MEKSSNNNQSTKKHKQIEQLHFMSILESQFTMWHRPQLSDLSKLKDQGINLVVTCQGANEMVNELAKQCHQIGMEHFWIKINGAGQSVMKKKHVIDHINSKLDELVELFKKQYKVLIHCAAGIHRTGTVSYSLMRRTGKSKEEAKEALKQIREVTFLQVGEWRLELAEQHLINR